MQRALAISVAVLIVMAQIGCTRVVVHKNPAPRDKGIRFYRPKPYLFITPSSGGGDKTTFKVEQTNPVKFEQVQPAAYQQEAGAETVCPAMPAPCCKVETKAPPTPDLTKISMQLMYLPDFAEEYSIRLTPGLGIGELNIKLDNGWNLTSVGIKTDQQTDEIIKSVADLVRSAGSLIAKARDGSGPEIYSTNIPFGFYEAVIATDPCGRKQLYGFRYVGFMPFQSCPVQGSGMEMQDCNSGAVYGMVYESGKLVFKQIACIPELGQKDAKCCPETIQQGPMTSQIPPMMRSVEAQRVSPASGYPVQR